MHDHTNVTYVPVNSNEKVIWKWVTFPMCVLRQFYFHLFSVAATFAFGAWQRTIDKKNYAQIQTRKKWCSFTHIAYIFHWPQLQVHTIMSIHNITRKAHHQCGECGKIFSQRENMIVSSNVDKWNFFMLHWKSKLFFFFFCRNTWILIARKTPFNARNVAKNTFGKKTWW